MEKQFERLDRGSGLVAPRRGMASIPFLQGRPVRTAAIGTTDIHDLIIALNTCQTLEDFLLRV